MMAASRTSAGTPSIPLRNKVDAPAIAPAEPRSSHAPEDPIDRMIHAAVGEFHGGFSPMGLAEAWFDWAVHLAMSPGRQFEIGAETFADLTELWSRAAGAAMNQGHCAPCALSLPQDKRFRSEAWQGWPFALYAEGHLAAERAWMRLTENVHGATRHHLQMLRFVGRQTLDLVSPSNSPLSNPDVLKATIANGGLNLTRGAKFAQDDLIRRWRHERPEAAEVYAPGHTVAITPGKVVHRTHLAEIIQYAPTTAKTHREPIVIVPAWIMRYYILDLSPENSLVKHLVDEGFTVFIISWRNPGIEDRRLGMDDYRTDGVLPAIEAARAITGSDSVHAVGYCIGGTLLAMTAADLARENKPALKTISLLAAQTDFKEAGELALFIDESQLAVLDDMMAERGVLEASQMAGTFHLLRSNDLIWSRMIRRYLMGEPETMTDIAAWSSDATRMPARMHSEYLRWFYLENDLAEGRLMIEGKPVSLEDLRQPIFVVGTEWDYVAPWRSVFKIHQLAGSDITFVLTNGGHNQGVVSPPTRKDRHYRLLTTRAADPRPDPDSWAQTADVNPGSWWPAWFAWLSAHAGPYEAPPSLGREETKFAVRADAPGTYVHG
ncbi:MAG: PHA/PHB synthase family protein [Beijerinckiaceae bacterium]